MIHRPIPCGSTGTYAHYGLIDGLMGFSVGSTSKDVRFYLDKLVEKFPTMFEGTIVDVHSKPSAVSSKFTRFQRHLLKWRWKMIKKAELATAEAGELIIIVANDE